MRVQTAARLGTSGVFLKPRLTRETPSRPSRARYLHVARATLSLSIEQAEAVIRSARDKAREIGVPMNVAVLDGAGHLKAFVRMDGAVLGSIDVALKKAKTAVLFGMNSEAVGEFSKPGGSSPGLAATNGGLVVFAGGIPIRDASGAVVGSVGVSGGAVDQDYSVALAAVAVRVS
jgi:uncharacterized protein GlcG (DUF336 family)